MVNHATSTIKIGLVMARPGHGLNELKRFVSTAKSVDLFVFPEGFLNGDKIARAKAIIAKYKKWVLCGVDDKYGPDYKVEQAILFNPNGDASVLHTKTSLTQTEIDQQYKAGNSLEPLHSPWGKIGVAICFEIHFPEVCRTLALKGARLIINPIGTGMWHERQFRQWNAIAAARASENEVPVVGVSHFNDAIPLAFAYNEWGDCLVCCRDHNRLVTIEINLPDVTKKRKFTQRRPELYQIITETK